MTKNKYGTIFTLKGEPWSDGKSASIQASSLVHRLVYTIGNYLVSRVIVVRIGTIFVCFSDVVC